MTQYESPVKHIPYAQQRVYNKLSDLNNLESLKGRVPENKVDNLSYDADHVSFNVTGIGNIRLKVLERAPFKCIKFESVESPIPFNAWIQLIEVSEEECKIRITLGLEVNMFMKSIVSKPVKEGLEKIVDILSMIQY
jgi:hypothetical protein